MRRRTLRSLVFGVCLGASAVSAQAAPRTTVTPTSDGSRIQLTLPAALSLTNARPELRIAGRVIGYPRVNGRTLILETTEPVAVDALVEAWLSGRRVDVPTTPDATKQTSAITPGIPVGQPVLDDPGRPGPFTVATGRYQRPDVSVGFRPRSEVVGEVVYPVDAPGARPLVLILHGRHTTCYRGKEEIGEWPCRRGYRPVPSENGYREMARVLASQGNVVVSIAANSINANDAVDLGGGAEARAALVDHHLRLWGTWATAGGAPFADMTGRVDLQRAILVGHSRGGEGVVRAATTRAPDAPWVVRGLVLVAPTAFATQPVIGIPTAVLLPTCDGDVSDLQGQTYLDRGRDVAPGDTALRSSVVIVGANHNAFNTEWMPRTSAAAGFNDSSCLARPNRITAATQRAVGTAYVAALIRVALEGNADAATLLDGSAVHAPSAGAATVYSSALGGARTRVFGAGDATTRTATGIAERICRAPTDPSLSDPGCFRSGSPHYLPPPFADTDLAASGLVANWEIPDGTLDVALPAPVAVGTASHLDLRVIVRRSSPDVRIDGALVDTTGREIPLVGSGDLRRIAGVSSRVATNWAQTMRFTIPPGNAAAAITTVRLRTRSPRGAIVILDGHLRTAGLPAIAPITVPQVDVTPSRVAEARPGARQPFAVTLAIRGVVSTPGRVRVAIFSPNQSLVRTSVVDVPVGATSIPIRLSVSGDRAYNVAPVGPLVQIVAVSGVTTGHDVRQVEVVDDDRRPGVIVRRRAIVVSEGDLVRIRVRLTRRIAPSNMAFAAVPIGRGQRSLSVNDLIETDGSVFLPFGPRRRTLADAEFGSLLSFSPRDLTETITFRIARDRRREGTERARFIITNGDGASRPIVGAPLVVNLVVRDRR